MSFQTWVGNILLFINSYEPAGPPTHVVLRRLAERLLADLSNSSQPRVLVFGGLSGSGKSFTADQLLMKMFQMSHKTDWIQDLRRVRVIGIGVCSIPVYHTPWFVDSPFKKVLLFMGGIFIFDASTRLFIG